MREREEGGGGRVDWISFMIMAFYGHCVVGNRKGCGRWRKGWRSAIYGTHKDGTEELFIGWH